MRSQVRRSRPEAGRLTSPPASRWRRSAQAPQRPWTRRSAAPPRPLGAGRCSAALPAGQGSGLRHHPGPLQCTRKAHGYSSALPAAQESGPRRNPSPLQCRGPWAQSTAAALQRWLKRVGMTGLLPHGPTAELRMCPMLSAWHTPACSPFGPSHGTLKDFAHHIAVLYHRQQPLASFTIRLQLLDAHQERPNPTSGKAQQRRAAHLLCQGPAAEKIRRHPHTPACAPWPPPIARPAALLQVLSLHADHKACASTRSSFFLADRPCCSS